MYALLNVVEVALGQKKGEDGDYKRAHFFTLCRKISQ